MAGAINLALFDKTGTLTEDKFDFVGVYQTNPDRNEFQKLRKTNFSEGSTKIAFDSKPENQFVARSIGIPYVTYGM